MRPSILILMFSIVRPSLFLDDGPEVAASHTRTALDALVLIDGVDEFVRERFDGDGIRGRRDAVHRAVTGAEGAAHALFGKDLILHQVLADVGRALLLFDVRFVFFREVRHRGENRVRGGLAEGAEGAVFDDGGEFLHVFESLFGALSFGDGGEHFEQTLRADTAGRALTAGFVDDEVHVEVGDVNHAVVFVHDDRAAGAHHGAAGDESVVVDRGVEVFLGQAAAGRTAGLNGFEGLVARDAAADVIDEGAEGGTHRDFDETDVVDLAAEGEDLGALGAFGTDAVERSGAFAKDEGNLGKGFDVIDAGRFAPKAFDSREGRTGTRHATLTFDGVKKSGFFAADEGTGAKTDMGTEAEIGTEDVITEQTNFLHIFDGTLQTRDRDGVFGTDVEVAFGSAERVAGDHHTFDDFEGVAFEDRTVHERAGVAFVTVADDVFLIGLDVGRELPFTAGGEATAATAADARGEDFVDDFLRGHLGDGPLQAFEAIVAEGFFEEVRIDERAAVESDTDLLLVEVDIVLFSDFLVGLRVNVEEVLADFSADDVLLDDLFDIGDLNGAIEGIFGEDFDEGALGAEAEATDVVDGDFVFETVGLEFLLDLGLDIDRVIGDTARTTADDDGALAAFALQFGMKDFGTFRDMGIEGLDGFDLFHD